MDPQPTMRERIEAAIECIEGDDLIGAIAILHLALAILEAEDEISDRARNDRA